MTAYFDAIKEAMSLLAAQPNALFLGQSVEAGGTAMAATLAHVPASQRLELPVFEETQLGLSIGLSLAGVLPISIYPRINFLLLAVGQLVLHLDRLPVYSAYRPKVIVRTAVAHDEPMDPGPQHLGDFSFGLEAMLRTVEVERILHADQALPVYQRALDRAGSTLVVEYLEHY